MGFAKRREAKDDGDDEVKAPKERKFKEGRGGKFTPTTKEEWKRISKKARKREKQKDSEKQAKKDARKNRPPMMAGDKLRHALETGETFRVYASNLFDTFIQFCKDNDVEKPRYKAYLDSAEAQSDFMFQVATAMARMSWVQLTDLLHASITTDNKPVGIASRSWSEALKFATRCVHIALGVVEKKGTLRLTDLSVLDEWPVSERKRKSKEEKDMGLKAERRNASLKAKGKDDEDDDDDDEEEEDEEDTDDEDEESDNEDSDDEDSDDEEDDNDDDEDDSKSKKSAKRGSRGKSSKNDEDDDDEDDDDEDSDEDEDEDDDEDTEKSSKKEKSVSKKSKKAKGKKSDDKDTKKPAKKADKKSNKKADKPAKVAKVKLEDGSKLSKVRSRDKGGVKTKLLDLIPKKGSITLKKLKAAAVEAEIPKGKIESLVKGLVKNGYVKAE